MNTHRIFFKIDLATFLECNEIKFLQKLINGALIKELLILSPHSIVSLLLRERLDMVGMSSVFISVYFTLFIFDSVDNN